MEFHRGRLIDHIRVPVRDIAASRKFYAAVLAALSVPIEREGDGWFLADELMVHLAEGKRKPSPMHVALQAQDQETVRHVYQAGLDAGGKKASAPAKHDYHPYYYSGSLRDPDGHVIEVVNHGPISRSAPSVVVKPSAMAFLRNLF